MNSTPRPSERSARLNLRIAPDALDTIREAAGSQQQDVTSFVLGAALDRARAVLMEERVMRLTAPETARLDQELGREPRVIPELAALLQQVARHEVRGSARVTATT